jgi:hypothetical protein
MLALPAVLHCGAHACGGAAAGRGEASPLDSLWGGTGAGAGSRLAGRYLECNEAIQVKLFKYQAGAIDARPSRRLGVTRRETSRSLHCQKTSFTVGEAVALWTNSDNEHFVQLLTNNSHDSAPYAHSRVYSFHKCYNSYMD